MEKFSVGRKMTKTSVEYADEQITVYPAPCPLKCKYCWSNQPIWIYRTRRANPIKEAIRLARTHFDRIIVISFTTDPYQPRELKEHLTRKALEILAKGENLGHRVMVLSKSCLMEEDFPFFKLWRDQGFDLWVGTSLTSVIQISDEPCLWTNVHRIVMLQRAHNLGLPTWVSIEPWIPDRTFPRQIIEATHAFVDWYVIGRLSYVKRLGYSAIPEGYYREETIKTGELLRSLGFILSREPCRKGYWMKRELIANP